VNSAEILETEWQYDAPDLGVLSKWLTENSRSGPLSVLPGESRKIHDLYLDTSEMKILRAGYALRIRRTAKSAEASLKELAPRIGSLAVRREITQSLASARKRRSSRAGPSYGAPAATLPGGRTEPLGAIWTERQIYRITYGVEDPSQSDEPQLPTAEVALDRSFLTDPLGRAHRLSRLEIEVSQQDVQTFRTLADRLCEECRLRAAEQSKFEWAMGRTASAWTGRCLWEPWRSSARCPSVRSRTRSCASISRLSSGTNQEPAWVTIRRISTACACRPPLRAALKLFCMAYPDGRRTGFATGSASLGAIWERFAISTCSLKRSGGSAATSCRWTPERAPPAPPSYAERERARNE